MSGVWLIALGLAAGYLMQKNQNMMGVATQSHTTFNSTVAPAKPGPKTEEIRDVQRTLPAADRNEDLNMQDLTSKDAQTLRAKRDAAAQEVVLYENAFTTPPIQGVYLQYDNHGV